MARANFTQPLALTLDQRNGLAYAALTTPKDQVRINSEYEIPRPSVGVAPEIVLSKRPGPVNDGNTYGADGQVIYLVGYDPASTWDVTAWVFVKNGTNNNVVSSATSTTILNNTNFQPRFQSFVTLNVGGTPTNYCVVQLQNTATPSGAANQEVYYASVIGTWTKISDAVFTALNHRGKMEFMDGFAFQADATNKIHQSSVNNLAVWPANDFIVKSATQDPPQGLIKVKDQILHFGIETVEAFKNAGNATGSVLERIKGSVQKIGLANVAGGGAGLAGKTNYYCTFGDVTFFCGRYGGASADTSLIAYNGSRFEKISRPPEDKLLSSTEIYSLNAFAYQGKVAVAIQLTAPTASTQRWLQFYPDINDWFLWESTVYSPVNNGRHYAGIANEQKLYTFPAQNRWDDDGTAFTMTTQFRLSLPDDSWHTMPYCGVIADTTGTTQNLGVSFSDDDGATWSSARNIDLSLRRKFLTACGGFTERFVRLTHTGTGEVRLRKFFASIGN